MLVESHSETFPRPQHSPPKPHPPPPFFPPIPRSPLPSQPEHTRRKDSSTRSALTFRCALPSLPPSRSHLKKISQLRWLAGPGPPPFRTSCRENDCPCTARLPGPPAYMPPPPPPPPAREAVTRAAVRPPPAPPTLPTLPTALAPPPPDRLSWPRSVASAAAGSWGGRKRAVGDMQPRRIRKWAGNGGIQDRGWVDGWRGGGGGEIF